ncbi:MULTISPECIES: anti-sigma factor [unclassified Actinomyces]|uniref:anti-sigma factor n=1 Tax=unclassified Actinomyces TaxID=2609248 RepID=UPI0013585FD8|nr:MULTISPECIES: anti-sigma factor [unclassified Actinomyces]
MSREGQDMTAATRIGVDDEELRKLLDGETGALLGASLTPVEPSAGMRAALLERIKGVEQDGAAPAPGDHSETGRADAPRGSDDAEELAPVIPLRRRRAWRYTAQAAAAVALIAAGFGAGYGSGYGSGYDGGHDTAMEHVTPMIDYTHLNQAQDVRRVTDTMSDGHVATLTWSEGMSMTALSLPAAMSASTGGTALQMWLEDPTSGITSLGTYAPDKGTTFTFLPMMPKPGQRVLITAEPAGGSAQPTTRPLVVLAVGGQGGDGGSGQGAGPSGPASTPSSSAASHA